MDDLYESLGAIFGWSYCKHYNEYIWQLLYWPALVFCGDPPQVAVVSADGFWSGFMSEGRGLSWDRKSRYGKK